MVLVSSDLAIAYILHGTLPSEPDPVVEADPVELIDELLWPVEAEQRFLRIQEP